MRLYFHYCPDGFSNCYVLASDSPSNEAVVIDPGIMDTGLLNIIEAHDFTLRGILITHDHPHHVHGVKTILRIYDTKVYACKPDIGGNRTCLLKDGDTVDIGPFRTEVILIPGHSADSAVFRIERLLFTGDSLTAGLTGSTASSYAAANQISALRGKILSLPGDYTVLPGHGPPSSLEAERRFNMDINSFTMWKSRPALKVD